MKLLVTTLFLFLAVLNCQADKAIIEKFVGEFKGDVKISESENRTLHVNVRQINDGFNVSWKTIIHKSSGSGKSKSYSIDFIRSDREGIYGSAMKTNLFGGQEALDPIKGEPYFWARLDSSKLTIYGMLITEDGDYEVQRYDRIIEGEDDDMLLEYTLTRGEEVIRTITATLLRQ